MRRLLIAMLVFVPSFLAAPHAVEAQQLRSPVPTVTTTTGLTPQATCDDRFVAHDLDHVTTTADGVVRMFEANGAGLAIADLDNDGRLDLVLGSQLGPNTLLWNEGSLRFSSQPWGQGPTRAITVVDVDADGWRDIVLTTNTGALNYWHNLGERTFERRLLPGVSQPAYVLNWRDLDGDDDLDLVTAPYDAGFLTDRGSDYLMDGGSAVFVYENDEGRFRPERVRAGGQALALLFIDLADDGPTAILVGNDFGVPDFAFVQEEGGWQEITLFDHTTHSTMSFDSGDIDNDGRWELFATDMKPYSADEMIMRAYAPLMAGMDGEAHMEADPQIMENVLQVPTETSMFENRASDWQVDGTGWSWSAQFGDLDNDGYLDLYVVNGMIEEEIFAHMPDHELVEENQVFRNHEGQRFEAMPSWQLNSTRSGRSMAMADLDEDGDLDVVVNNLRAPAQLFENRLCGGASLQVELVQPQSQNRSAIGAKLALVTDTGTRYRDVQAASGYLSGEASRIHFGVPDGEELIHLEIEWPDGARSVIDDLSLNTLLSVERQ